MVEDTETGEQHEVDYPDIDKHVEAMNKHAGYERYKVAPTTRSAPDAKGFHRVSVVSSAVRTRRSSHRAPPNRRRSYP